MLKNMGSFLKKGMKPGIGLFVVSVIGEMAWNIIRGDDGGHHKPPPGSGSRHVASKVHPPEGLFPSDTSKFPPPNKIPSIIESDEKNEQIPSETFIEKPSIVPDSEISDKSKINDDKNKMDDDKTKMDDDKTKMDDDKTKLDDDKTKMDDDKARMNDDKTKMSDDKTKMNDDKNKMNDDKNKINEEETDETLFEEPLVFPDIDIELDDDNNLIESRESPPPFTAKFGSPSFENTKTEILPCFPDKMKEKPEPVLKETFEVPPKEPESLTTPDVIDEIDRTLDTAVESLIDIKLYKAEKITVEGDTDEDVKSTSVDDSDSELQFHVEESLFKVEDTKTVIETSEDDEIRTESVIFISKPNEVNGESSQSDISEESDDILQKKPPRYRGYYDAEPEPNDSIPK